MSLRPYLLWHYPLWKGIAWCQRFGWRTYWYGITIGNIGIGIMIRSHKEEAAVSANGEKK